MSSVAGRQEAADTENDQGPDWFDVWPRLGGSFN